MFNGTIAIVGGGHIGQAICNGLVNTCEIPSESICVANPGEAKRVHIEDTYGVHTVACAAELPPTDVIIIAVRPAIALDVCAELVAAGLSQNSVIISVAAGVSTAAISKALGQSNPVVRVMPNAPLAYGAGVAGISAGTNCPENALMLAHDLFERLGGAVVVPEDQQDIVTAVSGSGPAYFELVLAAIENGAVELGMNAPAARKLALQTMYGTARMLLETGEDPAHALDTICTEGGTTQAALTAMREAHIEEIFAAGVRAAATRSQELAS